MIKMKQIIHYPRLKTLLMVEKVLKEADTTISREEIKRRMAVKIMHQSLNVILEYMEERGMIIDSHKGIIWVNNLSENNEKSKKEMEKKENIREDRTPSLKEISSKIIPMLKKNKVIKAWIFGSYAKGKQTNKSDIDIIIEVKNNKFSLIDLIKLERKLGEILNIKVDLLTYNGINPMLKKRILKEEIRII